MVNCFSDLRRGGRLSEKSFVLFIHYASRPNIFYPEIHEVDLWQVYASQQIVAFASFQLLPCTNRGTQGVQEYFLCEVSEIGAFTELFTVMIWLV